MKKIKGEYWKCEKCGKKVFDTFPATWIHVSFLRMQVGQGSFISSHDWNPSSYNTDQDNYDRFSDLTFCSLFCFLSWLKNRFGTNTNPSKRSP